MHQRTMRSASMRTQGEHCAALGEYQLASTRTRRGFPLVAMALVHRNWHDETHVAVYYLTRAIQQDPHYLRARALRADCLLELGEVKGALSDVSHALHKAPGHAVLLALHAECLLRLGRVREVAARRSTVPPLVKALSCPLASPHHTPSLTPNRWRRTAYTPSLTPNRWRRTVSL